VFFWFAIIFGSLFVGIFIGAGSLLPHGLYRRTSTITSGGLLLLLWAMGAQIGADKDLLVKLNTLGIKAFVLALASVLTSVLVLHWGVKLLIEKKLPQEKERQL